MVARENPALFKEMCNKSEPMLLPRQAKLIPEIHAELKKQNPDIDKTDESIMLAACIYQAFAPATMIGGSDLERLPNGIRPVMCNVMQWKDAPTANYYSRISSVYFKGNSFKERIMNVLNVFERFSSKTNQQQLF
ncbi:hypothetical protein WAE58_21615 [Pedobacter panaciterrae]|uniref:Uncharacterized protein n=2 Tax=Pedobacter panaciterrae TaxID=363849 RepID=A0ABU8NUY9_9SPHI